LFKASQEVLEGETPRETPDVLTKLRLAGGSPGGARPKAVVALSADGKQARSAFGQIPAGYDHWMIKFRAADEPVETGAIEFAYAQLAREVEKMARLMIYNALSHNYDDHTKNFAFLCNELICTEPTCTELTCTELTCTEPTKSSNTEYSATQYSDQATWTLAPAYDLTFAEARGEHSTAFAGHGKPTRKIINEMCKDYKFLKPNDYIDQTLAALGNWRGVFTQAKISHQAGVGLFRALEQLHKDFEVQVVRKN
jgi:serine/threonine-protein kinase HipA